MAEVSSEDMDSVNNNTMSNNNNSSNINNNNTAVGLNAVDTGGVAATPPSTTCGSANASHGDATTPTVCNVSAANTPNSGSGSGRSSRSSSSRRSHSRGRSRSHSRHRRSHHSGSHGSRHHSRHNRKSGERNFPAALCSMISIVILCTALAEPRWVSIDNGHCVLPKGRPLSYLGVFQFFSVGYIVYNDPDIDPKMNVIVEYRFGSGEDDRMINCVTERAVIIFKIIIGFTFLGIFTSLVSFGLDLIGSSHKLPKLLRRNAIFNVFTVFVCVGITLFLYLATVDICRVQQQIPNSHATVSFDVSFCLIAAAGFISVIGVACTCLRRVRPEPESPSARSILDDQFNQDIEQLVSVPSHTFVGPELSSPVAQTAPPPYTP